MEKTGAGKYFIIFIIVLLLILFCLVSVAFYYNFLSKESSITGHAVIKFISNSSSN